MRCRALGTVAAMRYKGFELYRFQEDAIRSIEAERSVIVSAPTGAGKTIIAEYAIEQAIERGRRIIYTSPIKALSNQKYRDFREEYGDRVGIMTGDVTMNPAAPVIIMTTEIFRNTIFEDSVRLDHVSHVIFDEVHYLGDLDRGSVWEESIIFAPAQIKFIALSATIGNLEELRKWMESVREARVDLVHTDDRPVPLHYFLFLPDKGVFEPKEIKEHLRPEAARRRRPRRTDRRRRRDLVRFLIKQKKLPTLYFSFSRRRCESLAGKYQRSRLLEPEDRTRIIQMYDELVDRYGISDHPAVESMRHAAACGVMYHHAGMLPVYKDIVERLFTSGLVKLLFTTETFALGVNMPARCVVFDSLTRWNGTEVVHISPLEFRQMAGRAGRQGIDEEGEVYAILDPRYDTPKRIQEILYKKPAPIVSKFALGYATILNLTRLMGDAIETAVEKSFLAFQRHSARKPLANLRRKQDVLESRGYLDGTTLTDKGGFCSRLAGFEIQLTELFWEGCFEDLDPIQAAVVCSAIIHEARRRDGETRVVTNPVPDEIQRRATKRVNAFIRAEKRSGLTETIRPLDFGLAGAIERWMKGVSFADLTRFISMQDGDLVRAFRLTIQVLRQLAWALPREHHVATACSTAIELLNRDEVDAEKQLRVR